MTSLQAFIAVAAALGGLGIGGIIVAIINKRADPFAQSQQLVDQLQEDRKSDREDRVSDREDRVRLEGKVDKLYDVVGAARDYGVAWELWHAEGMPDPPGPPRRPALFN